MRVDEAKLRAYLDNELPQPERAQVEAYLANRPQAQAVLAGLRQNRRLVIAALNRLQPGSETDSPASAALKRFQRQSAPTEAGRPVITGAGLEKPLAAVWESPSLLAELKSLSIKRGTIMNLSFALMVSAGLIGLISFLVFSALSTLPTHSTTFGPDSSSGQLPGMAEAVMPTPLPPTPTPVPTLTPTPVQVNLPFGYGLQADPQGDAEANVNHLQTLSFDWVKLRMPWKEVEPTPGGYDWTMWDKIIETYAANDVKVLLTILHAPDWARPADDDKSVEGVPTDPATYAQFVAQVADRYRGKIQAIEIWNEQNLWYKVGGKGQMDAAGYVKLLQATYRAIKAANPEMWVISGAMSPAGNMGNLAIDDIEYLRQMYTNGLKGNFDALGASPWGFNCPALANWQTITPKEANADPKHGLFTNRHHSWCFLGTMEAYREVMVANDDSDKAIAITQFGWAVSDKPESGFEYARDNTFEEQAQWTVEAYRWAKQQGWVGPMILWNLDYGLTMPPDITLFGAYNILDKPVYTALKETPK
jgi:hypothetical protein